MSCVKCSEDVSIVREKLTCVECKGEFHFACTTAEPVDNFKKLSAQKKSKWRCDTCKSEASSTASRSEQESPNLNSILESIKKMNTDLSNKMAEVNSNVSGIRGELREMKSSITEMKNSLEDLTVENQSRKEEYEKIVKENLELKESTDHLRVQVRNLEQYARRDNIEIAGIPFSKGENLYTILERIAGVLRLKVQPWDVSVVHRLPSRDNRRPPTIVVKFVTRSCKETWIRAAWECRKQLNGSRLSDTWPSHPFYINEHLTAFNKAILGRARDLKRERKLAYVWTRDSKVFVRKTGAEDCPPTLISTITDLDNLVKN